VTAASGKRVPHDLRLVCFDVDGVFTDGRFYLSDDGVESKAFCTHDGYGIRALLRAGVEVVVISGRQSLAVERRMAELGVRHVRQGCADKLLATLSIDASRTVYVGDDIPDLPLLRHAGFAIAVANAVPAVKQACDVITDAAGGYGAVREVCELALAAVNGN
jgi:3-deoxy-D-manno-octulosonate 8-phosphate phosphatase (KDO 8-P phosphatase)